MSVSLQALAVNGRATGPLYSMQLLPCSSMMCKARFCSFADKEIQDGDLVLLDMGTEYYRYGSDITVTLPANGKFTDKQRSIYEVCSLPAALLLT